MASIKNRLNQLERQHWFFRKQKPKTEPQIIHVPDGLTRAQQNKFIRKCKTDGDESRVCYMIVPVPVDMPFNRH